MSPAIRSKMFSDILPPPAMLIQGEDVAITGISVDSREVVPGDLFVAKRGLKDSGSRYIDDAIAKGARAILMDDSSKSSVQGNVPLARIPNLDKSLSAIANTFFDEPSEHLSVTGVTGTNGKTSCCFWYAWLSNQLGTPCAQIGTLGAGYHNQAEESLVTTGMTTPEAVRVQSILADVLGLGASATVMEVSSHGLDQGRVEAVIFESAIFTNFTQDHLDYHGDMNAYFAAKASLFEREELRRAILNKDDSTFGQLAAAVADNTELFSYSLSHSAADLFVEHVSWTDKGAEVVLNGRWGKFEVIVPVIGEYNLANVLAVVAALISSGISADLVVSALAGLPPVPGRMQLISRPHCPRVVVDYAHTPDAVSNALQALRSQVKGRLIVVLGCGGDRDRGKRVPMARAAAEGADVCWFTSDNPRFENPKDILDEMASCIEGESVRIVAKREDAIQQAIELASPEDLVAVLGKGHETYQEIAGSRIPFSDVDQCESALDGMLVGVSAE